MGRPRQLGGPHAEGRCVRVGVGIDRGVGNDPITPTARIRGEIERRSRAPPAPPGERPGVQGQSTPGYPRPHFKRMPGRRIANAKPPTPLGFSPLRHLRLRRERRGRGRRRAAPEDVNQLGTRTRERGAGAEEDDHRREHLPRLRTPLHRAGHDYTAAPP
jgi:hypothetical protein